MWQKNRKGVAGKGAEQVVKVVKGLELEQVPWWGQVVHLHTVSFTCHKLSLLPNLEHIFCLSQFNCVLCQCV